MTDKHLDSIKPIPKSLHTITVLRRFAAFIIQDSNGEVTPAEAIEIATKELGYWDTPDSYGLAAVALKQLEQGA